MNIQQAQLPKGDALNLPKGWEIKKLGEVCDFQGGSQPPKSNFIYEPRKGYVRFLQIRDFGSDKNITYIPESEKNRYCTEDDILLGRYGASVGKVLVNKSGAYNVAVMKTIPKENVLYKRYLFFYLNSDDFQSRLLKTASRSAQDGFSKDDIFDFPILLPPLPEQQRIVAILDEAFTAIAKAKANAEQNLKNAKELFESYLQEVFEKKGEGWEEKSLEDLADEKCTLSYGIVQPGEEYEDGLPVIRPTDLTSRYISLNGLKRIDPKLADGYKRTKLIGDELLLCVRGTTGVVSIATEELKDANVTRGIVPIRFNSKIINQEFGYYLLISNYIQKQIRAKTYGAALMQINIGDLRKINTPFPNLKEQHTIVKKLDALSAETKKLEDIYQQKINDLEELKRTILDKAFKGEI
jgi:type I restriction enzyme S subunit